MITFLLTFSTPYFCYQKTHSGFRSPTCKLQDEFVASIPSHIPALPKLLHIYNGSRKVGVDGGDNVVDYYSKHGI